MDAAGSCTLNPQGLATEARNSSLVIPSAGADTLSSSESRAKAVFPQAKCATTGRNIRLAIVA